MFLVRSVLVVASILLLVAPAQACVPLPPQGLHAVWADSTKTTITLKWRESLLADEVGVEGYMVHHLIDGEPVEAELVTGPRNATGFFSANITIGTGVHVLFVTAVTDADVESPPGNAFIIVQGRLVCTPIVPTLNPRGVIIDHDCIDGP